MPDAREELNRSVREGMTLQRVLKGSDKCHITYDLK